MTVCVIVLSLAAIDGQNGAKMVSDDEIATSTLKTQFDRYRALRANSNIYVELCNPFRYNIRVGNFDKSKDVCFNGT